MRAEWRVHLLYGHVRVGERAGDRLLHSHPRADRVVLDGRNYWEVHPDRPEEPRDPVGEVTHDVAGRPGRTGRGVVPPFGGHRKDAVSELASDARVALGNIAHNQADAGQAGKSSVTSDIRRAADTVPACPPVLSSS